jgi:hypothetical protein
VHVGTPACFCPQTAESIMLRCARCYCGVGWFCNLVRNAADACAVAREEQAIESPDSAALRFGASGCAALGTALKAGKVTGPFSPPPGL